MWLFGYGSLKTRLLLMSIAFLGTGAWMYAPTWRASKLVDCNLSQLATGKLPESNWVRVRGRLMWDHAAEEVGRHGHVRAYFVPLVHGSWNENQPVAVIVRINEFDADEMQNATTIEGLIQPLGLPFDLRIAFSGDDGAKASENVVYIHHGTDPHSQRRFAQVVLAIGFAGLLGFAAAWKFGGADKDTSYHSMAQARDINEAVTRTPEEELRRQEQEAQRESEIDRWMRERGLNKAAAEQEQEAATPVGAP